MKLPAFFLNPVQRKVNDIQLAIQWIASGPAIFYALIAGGLSDDFGRKPLILIPVVGYFITGIFDLINFIFIDTLPTEFFYFQGFYGFFGGASVYYMVTAHKI